MSLIQLHAAACAKGWVPPCVYLEHANALGRNTKGRHTPTVLMHNLHKSGHDIPYPHDVFSADAMQEEVGSDETITSPPTFVYLLRSQRRWVP